MNTYEYTRQASQTEGTSMTPAQALIAATAVFIGLTFTGLALALSALTIDDLTRQLVMVGFGAATYGAGLAFFLIQAFAYARGRSGR